MTANQIAYQTMLVDQKVRENQLEETQRHNHEVERLQDDANRYQKEYNDAQAEWLKFQANWKSEYESKYREWELALEEDKTRIQEDLARLEERKYLTDEDYKRRTSTADMMRAEAEKRKTDLQAEFQEFQKSAKWAELGLQEKDLALKQKKIEYDRAIQHEQNLFNYEIGKERNKISSDFNIAKVNFDYTNMLIQKENFNRQLQWNQEYGKTELDIRAGQLEFENRRYDTSGKALEKAQAFNLYTTGITGKEGMIGSIFNGFQTFGFTPLVGGLINGKTSQQAAKAAAAALFK